MNLLNRHEHQIREKSVIIALDLNGSTSRDVLSGILKYCSHQAKWSLQIARREELVRVLNSAEAGSGLIANIIPDSLEPLLRTRPDLAAVDIQSDNNLASAHVTDDDASIARLAYQYLHSLGSHRSYAYVPSAAPTYWSAERQREFERLAKLDGIAPVIFSPKEDDTLELRAFLRDLPKPAAVFCSYDVRAQDVIAAARRERLSIPGELSVLGVDNDEFICEATHPKISSVRADHVGIGYNLARELDRLFRSKKRRSAPRTVKCAALNVVVRETTAPVAQAAGYQIDRALAFIEKNASGEMRVIDVARHLGISRRLLELRFERYGDVTVSAAIRKATMEKAKLRLAGTTLPIREIARQLGFRNPVSFHHVFTREVGLPPGEYRRVSSGGAYACHQPSKIDGFNALQRHPQTDCHSGIAGQSNDGTPADGPP